MLKSVTRKNKDYPDGMPCNEWRIIDLKDVSDLEGRESIISAFEDTTEEERIEVVLTYFDKLNLLSS